MTTVVDAPAFFYDVSDELKIAKFPEDFADWLMDSGREPDAREFLARWQHIESVVVGKELEFRMVTELAEEYAPVIEMNEEFRDPAARSFAEVFGLLRDMEMVDEPTGEDPLLPWDRESAAVNQSLRDSPPMPATPVDMSDHEFPDVVVVVEESDSMTSILAKVVLSLAQAGRVGAARCFAQDLLWLTRRSATNEDLFELAWSYVDIVPETAIGESLGIL